MIYKFCDNDDEKLFQIMLESLVRDSFTCSDWMTNIALRENMEFHNRSGNVAVEEVTKPAPITIK